jgi:hypothetical protein
MDEALPEHNLGVAAQVEPVLKTHFRKPGDHISGSRVETRRFQVLWVNCIFNVYKPPHLGEVQRLEADGRLGVGAEPDDVLPVPLRHAVGQAVVVLAVVERHKLTPFGSKV